MKENKRIMKKLYVTYCSSGKQSGVNPPDRLYISDRISRFINRCRAVGVDWAIFSALYGFVFPEEEKKDYNVTLRTDKIYWLDVVVIKDQQKLSYEQSKKHIKKIVEKLKKQANERFVDKIIFYGPAPKMIKCYLKILHYTFDKCSQSHGWFELIEHVRNQSKMIKRIDRVEKIL